MATAKSKETSPAVVQSTEVPSYMAKFMQQSSSDAGSMAASSTSVPRLSFRGKRFRFIENGDEELVKELTTDVVILGVEPEAGLMIKTLYLAAYNPGDTSPPDCSSSNGRTPDAWVSEPQAERCAGCPKNIFGSATSRSGGKSKACSDGKRLWVAKADDLSTVYALGVPVTSLKNLSEYGKFVAKNNFPLALVVTTLGMDDESEFPKLTFTHKGFVTEDLSEEAISINTERPWRTDFGNVAIGHDVETKKQIAQPTEQVKQQPVATGGASVDAVIGSW